LIAAKRFEELVEMLDTPLVHRGGLTASLHFGLGLARMELKNFREAGEQFRQCLAKRDQPSLTPMNRDIRKAGPHHCLAICLMHLGEFAAAAEAFQQAMAADPQSRRVRFDFAAFLFSRGLPLEALQQLHVLAAEKSDELPVWLLGGQIALSQPQFSEFACDWTGEAIKQFPQERTISLQRAEALLLGERAAEALPLWRDACASSNDATHRAARILCELVAGEPAAAVPSGDEPAVSREFLKWYRRLITTGKTQTVAVLNDRIDRVAEVLPTTGKILEAALAEAQSPTAGAATESVSACA
jgi:tetratricopeptide (TPR) repeat protein